MKFALCNEMFGQVPHDEVFATTRALGYTGIEIAPFTLSDERGATDIRQVPASRLREIRQVAEAEGLQVVGLHWLLAKTEGFYLTSPENSVRRQTAEYLSALATACGELGGTIMVLGSPQQRNLLPGVSLDEAEQHAAEVLRAAMPACEASGVTIALEPLGPAEGDFMNTAADGIRLAQMVDSPHCQLHLDVKAMASEAKPVEQVIRESAEWVVHFHANDPNLLGPGMGEVEFAPIFHALDDIDYDGWVSVEVFRYEPSPKEVARQSIEYMRQFV